jgi:hypothetical protein
MTTARDAQQSRRCKRARAAASTAALALLLATAATPSASSTEHGVSGHRWIAPVWLSAPATSVLAVAGIAGLAAHLFRRRRSEKPRRPPAGRPTPKADDAEANDRQTDDWEQRLAMWERRLGGDRRLQERDGRDQPGRTPPPLH